MLNISDSEMKKIQEDNSRDFNLVSITNPEGIIEYVNEQFCKVSGYKSEELVGSTFKKVRHPETPEFVYDQLWINISEKKAWKGIFKNQDKDGKTYILSSTVIPILDDEGNLIKIKSVSYEITHYITQLNKHTGESRHNLSGLHNRETMMYDLEYRKEKYIRIAIIDIDNFKSVNDYYGYKIGDELIKAVAEKLKSIIGDEFEIYHISIDEFAIVKKANEDFVTNCDKCREISDKLENSHINLVSGLDLDISVSIGMSYGIDTWGVIKEADLAVSYAKEHNIQVVNFKNVEELSDVLEERVKWTKEIRTALQTDNIVPWIQAIRDNKTGEIVKFEALMRMIDETGSIISPFHFLEISKKTKLYEKVSYMMVDKTLDHFSKNHDSFNVNLTWDDLKTPATKNLIFEYLAKFPDLGKRMTIEMVESESIANASGFEEFIDSVRRYGVEIALDDFGSGYSNFVYLEHLHADFIKIDGSLIKGMMQRENTLFLVKAIVSIAKKFGIKTVAEFVSDAEIQKKVEDLGIDYSQGFYIGKPRPINW